MGEQQHGGGEARTRPHRVNQCLVPPFHRFSSSARGGERTEKVDEDRERRTGDERRERTLFATCCCVLCTCRHLGRGLRSLSPSASYSKNKAAAMFKAPSEMHYKSCPRPPCVALLFWSAAHAHSLSRSRAPRAHS